MMTTSMDLMDSMTLTISNVVVGGCRDDEKPGVDKLGGRYKSQNSRLVHYFTSGER